MNTKRILVSFLLIASVLFVVGMASALVFPIPATMPLATASDIGQITDIRVNDVSLMGTTTPVVGVNADDTIEVKVYFTAKDFDVTTTTEVEDSASDVRVKVTLEGEKDDVTTVTSNFDVVSNRSYVKTLTLRVPADFSNDNLHQLLDMDVKVWNSDFETEITNNIELELQRPSYDVAIKSVMTSSSVEAGQLLPVDIVLKNVGFNDLEDMYVTASIADLKLTKTAFFGNLVDVLEEDTSTDDDDTSTVSGRLFLEIPYNVKAGTYTLEVTAENDETSSTKLVDVVVTNSVPDVAMKSGNSLVLLNPTNQLKVYTVKYADTETSVIVSAGSSETVAITTPTSGEYNFDVSVFSGEQLLGKVNYSGTGSSAPTITSPVMVLTIILAVVFLVLLVVLIVLITKKPQKTEEFGESYY